MFAHDIQHFPCELCITRLSLDTYPILFQASKLQGEMKLKFFSDMKQFNLSSIAANSYNAQESRDSKFSRSCTTHWLERIMPAILLYLYIYNYSIKPIIDEWVSPSQQPIGLS